MKFNVSSDSSIEIETLLFQYSFSSSVTPPVLIKFKAPSFVTPSPIFIF